MKFDRKQLASFLPILRRSCSSNYPATLAFVKIEPTRQGFCFFTTTDLEATTQIRVEFGRENRDDLKAFAIPLKEFARFVRESDSEFVRIAIDWPEALISDAVALIKIEATAGDAYPETKVDFENWDDIPAGFFQAIDTAAHAVSLDETRYNLNGFWVIPEDDSLRIVATDGHRLARRLIPAVDIPSLSRDGAIIPRSFWACCPPALRNRMELGSIAFDGRLMGLRAPNIEWTFRLIEGEYPSWQQVVPAPGDLETVVLNRAKLIKVLKPFAGEAEKGKEPKVKLGFTAEQGICISSASRNVILNVDVEVPADLIGMEIGFNPRYLMESAKSLEGEKISLRMKTYRAPLPLDAPEDAPENPLKLNACAPATLDAGSPFECLNVVMPMRIE